MKTFFAACACVLIFAFQGYASDWKTLADNAIALSPDAVTALEKKQDKTAQDVYQLTILYYRQYDQAKLQKLLSDTEKTLADTQVGRLLAAIVLMRKHQLADSANVLNRILSSEPDFYPALIVLAHLSYLQKDFTGSYAQAKKLLEHKKALSRYHYTVSLLMAAGARGILAKSDLTRAIPGYFEVKRYFKEAQKLMPGAPEVLYARGSYYLLTPPIADGDIDLAMEMLEKSRALTPLNPSVYVRLAQGYRARGDEEGYRKNLDAARALDPKDELVLDYLSGDKAFLDVP